jgi:hypothetical protein
MALVCRFWRWITSLGSGFLPNISLFSIILYFKVVTTVPTKGLPKNLTIGGGEVEADTANILGGDEDGESREKRSGQILWIRGLTRLQTQVLYNTK